MTEYLVVRDMTPGQTDKVALFSCDYGGDRTHIRRIQTISEFRNVGTVTSDIERLELRTASGAVSDTDLLRRTGVDVRHLRTPIRAARQARRARD